MSPIPTPPPAAPRQYAVEEDYRQWTGDGAATVSDALLVQASRLVDQALIGAVYETDDEGYPADSLVFGALRDATCAQVAWWAETGDDTGTGAAGQFAAASIGSANYTRAGGDSKGNGKSMAERLDATAHGVLRVAGLLPVSPCVTG